jgi:coenzyme F420-0:L-glutamate ligase / coenzyme F420-1:gamma-L-glutamate ligase
VGDAPIAALEIFPVQGIGEVAAGDDVAALVVEALAVAGERLLDGDVLVVSSKVVSKAEGRLVAADTRDAAVEAETVRILAERSGPLGTTRVVQSRSGPVLAAAGVDSSNVAPGTVLLLPADPDASAARLHAALLASAGVAVGVVVSDTAGRAWRDGQVDLAIGAAGIRVTDDLRGGTDPYGNPLEVTVRALADELAAAADLVKGKLRGVPAAVVRGLPDVVPPPPAPGTLPGPGAAALLRDPGGDWFALGHVEAVRAALGVPPGTPGVPPSALVPDDATSRLRRAAVVALAAPDPFGGEPGRVEVVPPVAGAGAGTASTALVSGPSGPAAGALVQRLLAAAWAEGLRTAVGPATPASPTRWRVTAVPLPATRNSGDGRT